MDDALERFVESLPEPLRSKLDFSIESLDPLESWILSTYVDPKAMFLPKESARVGGAARYIGETIRKTVGGHWDIELENQNESISGCLKSPVSR